MSDGSPTPAPHREHKLVTVAVILYGTLALLALAMPQSLASRLDDLDLSPVVRAAQAGVQALTAASNALGVVPLYRGARARFLTIAGLQQD